MPCARAPASARRMPMTPKVMASTTCASAASPHQQNTRLVIPSTRLATAMPLADCLHLMAGQRCHGGVRLPGALTGACLRVLAHLLLQGLGRGGVSSAYRTPRVATWGTGEVSRGLLRFCMPIAPRPPLVGEFKVVVARKLGRPKT